jgi:hypothetical protein
MLQEKPPIREESDQSSDDLSIPPHKLIKLSAKAQDKAAHKAADKSFQESLLQDALEEPPIPTPQYQNETKVSADSADAILPSPNPIYGSIITLLPVRFQFGVRDPKGPGFSIGPDGPPRQAPVEPKTNSAITMIDIGYVTDDCPPIEYKRAVLARAGQIACAVRNGRARP